MNIKLVSLLSTIAAITFHSDAATISQWSFETHPAAGLLNSATITGIAAEVGNGTASGVHSSATTDWTTPAGNGSARSLSANTWSVGDYWQFQVSTIGYSDISVSYAQTSSATGPSRFIFSYSTDGTLFNPFLSNYFVPVQAWTSGSENSSSVLTHDLSSLTGLDNVSEIYFRIIDANTTTASGEMVGTSGTSRIDNFTVIGTARSPAVPETLPFGFIACFLVGLLAFSKYLLTHTTSLKVSKIRVVSRMD